MINIWIWIMNMIYIYTEIIQKYIEMTWKLTYPMRKHSFANVPVHFYLKNQNISKPCPFWVHKTKHIVRAGKTLFGDQRKAQFVITPYLVSISISQCLVQHFSHWTGCRFPNLKDISVHKDGVHLNLLGKPRFELKFCRGIKRRLFKVAKLFCQ